MRESVRTAFADTDIEIVGEAATPWEALEQASDPRVDVLLLDMHWPQGAERDSEHEGIQILKAVRSMRPGLGILMYSVDDSTDCNCCAVRAVDAGTEIWPYSSFSWESPEGETQGLDAELED